ncbi:MAG: LptE family protein [Desulfobacteraceae bacterium]|nr:LptE family protein [Desulfobacteraceae bacterium]
MKKTKWLSAVCLFVFFASCGYQFEGGGYINKDVTRVAVKVFENKSSEISAGILFTNSLIREIIEKTDTTIVDEKDAAAVVVGKIKAITFSTLSRSTTESVAERRVSAVIDLKLVNKDGDVIWSVKDFASDDNYTVSEDNIIDETSKREAVEKIAERSAEKIISKLLIDF